MSNEAMWAESFGDEYTVRNDVKMDGRVKFFTELSNRYKFKRVLEVGCNIGTNLQHLGDSEKWGCDVNRKALTILHSRHQHINAVCHSGYDIPFKDDFFDLVFTCGVLIHQKPSEVERMMQEIIRVSSHYVLAMEYGAPTFEEIPYRGNKEALFKGPYGSVYEGRYGLRLVETGFLGKEAGFDNVTTWLFSKT